MGRERKFWQRRVRLFLCDKARPSERDWRALVTRLAKWVTANGQIIEELGTENSPLDPREPLIWAWTALAAAPDDVKREYARYPETTADGSGIADRADRLRDARYAVDGLPSAVALHLPWLAALTRVLDEDLAALVPVDDPADWVHEVPGYDCWVVPVDRPQRLKQGRQPERRALCHHAVIPKRIGSLAVRLVVHPALTAPIQNSPLAAAMFQGLAAVERFPGTADLVLADVAVPNVAEAVGAQIHAAEADRCAILAWPELTTPAKTELAMRRVLETDALRDGRVPLVVAGSWHVALNGPKERFANESTILDARGRLLARYRKRIPFVSKGRREKIVPGNELLIFASAESLISIAICRDFCDDTPTCNYDDLPLDLVIVPSMGDEDTLNAQVRHARSFASRQGGATFLVQQHDGAESGAKRPKAGYSFHGSGAGGGASHRQSRNYRALPRRDS